MAWRQSYQLDETRPSNSAVRRPAMYHGNPRCRLVRLVDEAGVRHGGRVDQLDAFVAIGSTVEVVEEPLVTAEQDGHEGQMHLVDQSGSEVLLDGRWAPTDPDVLSIFGLKRLLERGLRTSVGPTRRAAPTPTLA
jgi:hypothetical protein